MIDLQDAIYTNRSLTSSINLLQERIAKRFGALQKTVSNHLVKMATLPFLLDADLSKGYTV